MELCWRGSSTGNSRKRNKRILLSQEKDMNENIRNAALQKTAFFISLPGYKNRKRVTAVTQYLVNLKSNTMKNTHANIERICEPHKLFLKKMLFLKTF